MYGTLGFGIPRVTGHWVEGREGWCGMHKKQTNQNKIKQIQVGESVRVHEVPLKHDL